MTIRLAVSVLRILSLVTISVIIIAFAAARETTAVIVANAGRVVLTRWVGVLGVVLQFEELAVDEIYERLKRARRGRSNTKNEASPSWEGFGYGSLRLVVVDGMAALVSPNMSHGYAVVRSSRNFSEPSPIPDFHQSFC